MKTQNNKSRPIRRKLFFLYGTIMLITLLLFVIFSLTIIGRLKKEGLDQIVENSVESIFNNVDSLIKNSVKQYLDLENKKILVLTETYASLAEEGTLSEEEAKSKAIAIVRNTKTGEVGYSYITDFNGKAIVHPLEQYKNYNFSDSEIFKQQKMLGEGYIEYKQKRPANSTELDKMMYYRQFEPWGWIISTTAYTDDQDIINLRIGDINNFIRVENSHGLGCITLFNGNGDFLIEPQNRSKDFSGVPAVLKQHLEEIKTNRIGRLRVNIDNKNTGGSSRVIIFYRYFPSMNWIIANLEYSKELYSSVYKSYLILVLSVIFSMLLFFILNVRLSKKLSSPLHELVRILDSSADGDLSVRADIKTGDEFEILGNHFNTFMELQQDFIEKMDNAQKSIKILAKFPDDNPNPVIRISENRTIEYANSKAEKLILTPLGLQKGNTIPELILKGLTSHDTLIGRNEYAIDDKTYSFTTTTITDPNGTYLFGRDITRQKKYESLQLLSENIFKNSIEGIVITDSEANIESINLAFTTITGFTEEDAIGKNPRILKSHRQDEAFYKKMWQQLINKGYWSGEIWNRRKNGQVFPERLTITSTRDDKGAIIRFISFFHDLSEVKEKEEKILYEATHDHLTGLPNRELLMGEIDKQIKLTGPAHAPLRIIYIDIKNLKRINKSAGPETGDILLIEASRRLREFFKVPALVSRIGSDEFACLLPDRTDEEISETVKEIIRIFKPPFIIKGREIYIELSAGIASSPPDSDVAIELVAKAEDAMRHSKQDINSPFSFYSPSFREKGLTRLEIESGLKSAFEKEQFYINYQPKVTASDGSIMGSEALVRLRPIDGHFIGPDIFIPIAEEIGLIEALGTWVLEKACSDTKRLINKGYNHIQTAVNLSPWQFRKAELPGQIRNIITSFGLPAENLNLEITESMAIDNVDESIKMMHKLTDIGLSMSIDDFGTGYSSLSYLSKFPVNILKIDKSFVDGVPEDSKMTGVVLAILSLAQNLGMKTVAEGVETEDQYKFLREQGSTQIQGYYFYKPMLFDEFEAALSENSLKKPIT